MSILSKFGSKKYIAFSAVGLALVASTGVGWKYHETPRFCADMCHVMEPYLDSWRGSDFTASAHAAQGVACLDCHEPSIQEQVTELITFWKGDYTTPLEELQVSEAFCYDCHLLDEHESRDQVIQRTAELERNPHDSHLIEEMNCTACHKIHKASQDQCAVCHDAIATGAEWTTEVTRTAEIKVWEPTMDCSSCKSMVPYVNSLTDSDLMASAHAEEGLVCLDCHVEEKTMLVHESAVPSDRPLKPRQFTMETCFTCHVENEHTSYQEVAGRTIDTIIADELHNPHDPHTAAAHVEQLECYTCHKMHKESPLTAGCYDCHHEGGLVSCSGADCHIDAVE
ncbi:MAG: ammonia-forming cytochrome c nitrite reductase subunit c552 [Anaerolineales bacterium]|nr:ammonia-forming cytochrome c nitrite reductase subunit c552 [Anaerolineales bacterium]